MTVCQTTTALASSARTASNSKRSMAGPFRLLLGLSTALTPVWAVADSLPTGGVVTSGQATITNPSTSTLIIKQGTNTAVVDWNDFSIGQGNTVTFDQPTSNASILNRVTGDATSQIHGSLNANGQVYVVNPNGIFIGKTGTIDAGGFVASTLGIRNEDFVLGKPVFEGNGNSAKVTNQGTITIVPGGYAALLGGKVSNSGTILAPLGKVGLGAGERATLDFAGDGFLQVAIPSDSDDDGLEALIENSGTISANGGQVHIQAATARHAVRHAINLGGIVEARSVSGRNGAITLGGGGGGVVRVTGRVRTAPYIQVTQSARPPVRGGDITITGNQITLDGATLDASGTGDGGSIRIGGNYQGGAGLQTADSVNIDAATWLRADAGRHGDGGRVIVWADRDTKFDGQISARGGTLSGNGGFAEVSGKITLSYTGLADLRAPNGDAGMLLLDPEDIFIVETASGPNDIAASTVNAQLELGDLTLSTENPSATDAGDINVNAALAWDSANRLTLEVDNDININADITAAQGRLTLDGFRDVTATGAINVGRFALEAGDWVQIAVTLPGFTTTDFTVGPDASFLRALSGEGSNEDPYMITDVYGLQGIGTGTYGLDTFMLDNDIDASSTNGWDTFNDTFALGTDGRGFNPIATLAGALEGNDFAIDGLYVDRGNVGLDEQNAHGGLIGTIDDGAIVRSLTFTNTNVAGSTGGALARTNLGDVFDVSVIGGTVTGEGRSTEGLAELTPTGGLIGTNDGTVTSSFSSATVRTRLGDVTDQALGGLVGINAADGTIVTSRATGTVLQQIGNDVDAGGLVGLNQGTIEASVATAPNVVVREADTANIGGFVGRNVGSITISHSEAGTASGVEAGGSPSEELNIGGLVGLNDGTIENAYSLTDVTGRDTGILSIGGLIGRNTNSAELVFSAGAVTSDVGGANIGGLIGILDSGSFVDGGFWDTETSGQTTSDGGAGLTTAQMQDTEFFLSAAGPAGWDLANVWAPSDAGFYPVFYRTSPVIFAQADAVSFQYNGTTDDFNFTGTFAGGVDAYAFNPFGEVLDNTTLNDTAQLSGSDVGTQTIEYTATTITGDLGTDFRVVSADADATITAAPLTITANDQTKTYGDLFTFTGNELTTTGLFAGDTVASATITSNATPVTATVTPPFSDLGAYDISIGDAAGTGLANYDITYEAGSFTVNPAALTLTADDQSKVYGTTFTFDNTEFTVTGLRNSDTVTSAEVISIGADATATVAGGPYAIVLSNEAGTGLENYTINRLNGSLDVTPAPLQVTVDDQTKVYGDTFTFDGSELTGTEFLNGDSLTSATLTSAGADATARVDGSDYAITAADFVGNGMGNYDVTVTDGSFTVTPAALTITADDQTKTYGDTFTFDGTEFSATGLLNGDTIDSADLFSSGASALAQVADGPFGITAANAQGADVSNYDITFAAGEMTLNTRNITITADDQTKQFETEFTFDGSEFTVTGLVNEDEIASVDLFSEGAPIDATVEGSPYAIVITAVNAADPSDGGGGDVFLAPLDDDGLANYNIALVDGVMNVVATATGTPVINPIPPYGIGELPNPTDNLQFTPTSSTGGSLSATPSIQQSGSNAVQQATRTFERVDAAADRLDSDLATCDSSVRGFGSYVNCLAETLDEFADALDGLEKDLPRGLEDVSAIIDNARDGVRAAGQRANRRLATATTDTQRRAIQSQAVSEARNALATAKTEIRKSISLIRADDPDLVRVQKATVNRIVNAVDAVETKLVRAATL